MTIFVCVMESKLNKKEMNVKKNTHAHTHTNKKKKRCCEGQCFLLSSRKDFLNPPQLFTIKEALFSKQMFVSLAFFVWI